MHFKMPDAGRLARSLTSLESLRIAGWAISSLPDGISGLTKLSVLRLLAPPSPALALLHLPAEVAALAPSLRRLSFFSRYPHEYECGSCCVCGAAEASLVSSKPALSLCRPCRPCIWLKPSRAFFVRHHEVSAICSA